MSLPEAELKAGKIAGFLPVPPDFMIYYAET
jgi:hypothetical protein